MQYVHEVKVGRASVLILPTKVHTETTSDRWTPDLLNTHTHTHTDVGTEQNRGDFNLELTTAIPFRTEISMFVRVSMSCVRLSTCLDSGAVLCLFLVGRTTYSSLDIFDQINTEQQEVLLHIQLHKNKDDWRLRSYVIQ